MEHNKDELDSGPAEAIPAGREAEQHDSVADAEDFPPWSMKIIVLGIVGYLVLNVLSGLAVGACVALGTMWFGWDMNLHEQIYVGVVLAEPVYVAQGIAVILLLCTLSPSFLRNAWISYALEAKWIGLGILLGLLFGVGSAIAYMAPDTEAISWSPPLVGMSGTQLLAWHLVFRAFAGPIEEVLFRGVVHQAFRKRLATSRAVLTSAAVFSVLHVDHLGSSLQTVLNLVFGILAALLFERTRSLNSPACFHATVNAATLLMHRYRSALAP